MHYRTIRGQIASFIINTHTNPIILLVIHRAIMNELLHQ